MFGRLAIADGQTRATRSIEWFGWIELALGSILLKDPGIAVSVLHLPMLNVQGGHYLRLTGLLVSGLGMLYVACGRLNSAEFAFASMLDRPLVPVVMVVLVRKGILPAPLAVAFAVSDFGSFLWTLTAWFKDARLGPPADPRNFLTKGIDAAFGFISGVIRNARTFHPDGRAFLATIGPLHPEDAGLARASSQLTGRVLIRVGMGVMKRGMPRWLADAFPDAPSMALRIYDASAPGEVRLERRPGEDLDLLCTAGGDRLWKLLLNLATGGFMFGLHKFDYFRNTYYADVPYRIDDGRLDVWIRLAPAAGSVPSSGESRDGFARELQLTIAVADQAAMRIEAQRVGRDGEPFVPIAELRFQSEIQIDHEALHFDPVAGRGFVPYGALAVLRAGYPVQIAAP